MRVAVIKEMVLVGASTLVVGYTIQKGAKKVNLDLNPLVLYFSIGFIAHLLWEITGGNKWFVENAKFPVITGPKVLEGSEHTAKPLVLEDPDLKILLDVEGHIHPDAKKRKAKEMGPKLCQVYGVKLFDKKWCDALVRVSERYGLWGNASKGGGESVGMTLPIDFIPELQKKYSEAVKKYIFPCAQKLFPTFNPTHHDEVYILRYIAGRKGQDSMDNHYDGEPLACILALNEEFKGGGTHFPKYNLTVVAKPGVMLLYPGGLSHLHSGKMISNGRRYLILHALYDKELNGDTVSVWEDGEPQHDRVTPVSRG